MEVYTFTSSTITNIWAGIGAELWAISEDQSTRIVGIDKRAANMLVGSLGVIYCSETHSFTTPFLVSGPATPGPAPKVWPKDWAFAFRIKPLGTPERQLHTDQAQVVLPILQKSSKRWDHIFHIQGRLVFNPTTITPEDWQVFLHHLAV